MYWPRDFSHLHYDLSKSFRADKTWYGRTIKYLFTRWDWYKRGLDWKTRGNYERDFIDRHNELVNRIKAGLAMAINKAREK